MFINIEGIDGSGKGTQFNLLKNKMIDNGNKIAIFDFPRYGQDSAKPIEMYLRGEIKDLNPYQVAQLFAIDRLAARHEITSALAKSAIILTNRYVPSNVVYQSALEQDAKKQDQIIKFIEDLEYGVNELPIPDINIITSINHEISQRNVLNKSTREYVKGLDINENNITLQKRVAKIYDYFCNTRSNFIKIDCMKNDGEMHSPLDIHKKIWLIVSQYIVNEA